MTENIATGLLPPTVLYNELQEVGHLSYLGNCKTVNSGALTADTYPGTPQISLTGPGYLNWLSFYTADSTTRGVTIKIVIDGTEVFEDTVSGIAATGSGGVAVGVAPNDISSTGPGGMDQIPFNSTCQVYLKSTVTETDKCTLQYIARKC